MSTKVFTESVCDRCGQKEQREGAAGSCPPAGWARIRLMQRQQGAGWSNSHVLFDGEICHDCTAWAQVVLESKPEGDVQND